MTSSNSIAQLCSLLLVVSVGGLCSCNRGEAANESTADDGDVYIDPHDVDVRAVKADVEAALEIAFPEAVSTEVRIEVDEGHLLVDVTVISQRFSSLTPVQAAAVISRVVSPVTPRVEEVGYAFGGYSPE